jgi:Leucine-rich repeat (LRR) protein
MEDYLSFHPGHGTRHMDAFAQLAKHPEMNLEALMEYATQWRPNNGSHAFFLQRASAAQFRAWLPALQTIDLNGQGLSAFPDALRHVPEVEHLLLPINDIKALPEWLPALHRLQSLHLGNNPLRKLSPVISDLFALRDLQLARSEIEDISGIHKAPALEKLGLGFCSGIQAESLRYLPHSLTDLDLSGTTIDAFPAEAHGHVHLSVLRLRYATRMDPSRLQDFLFSLPKLREIHVDKHFRLPQQSIPPQAGLKIMNA